MTASKAPQELDDLTSELVRWEKLARDADEQTPAGDGGQRMPARRRICPLCDMPPDYRCQFANCKRNFAQFE